MDATVLGAAGRRVRCVRCGHVWHQVPEPEPEATDAAIAIPDLESPRPHQQTHFTFPEEPSSSTFNRGWVVFAAAVVLLVGGVLLAQRQLVDLWPPSARLFETLGIASTVAATPLSIRDVTPEARLEDGERLVVVTGRVVNESGASVDLPPLEVALVAAGGQVLSRLAAPMGRESLEHGESAAFAVEFANPAPEAEHIRVAFAVPATH